MPAAVILALVQALAPYGIEAVTAIITAFSAKTAPTQAQWDSLLASTSITARDQMLDTLRRHSIDPASAQGVAMLALVPA